ncbi:TOBE domain-containing protein [Streptomyces sp. NPDC003444]
MSLIVRNQFASTIVSIAPVGEATVLVEARIAGRRKMSAVVSSTELKELGLDRGSKARMAFQSSRVSLATGPMKRLSIRNQIPGKVTSITVDGAMASVWVSTAERKLVATITRDAVIALELKTGSSVVALIDSTDVLLDTA